MFIEGVDTEEKAILFTRFSAIIDQKPKTLVKYGYSGAESYEIRDFDSDILYILHLEVVANFDELGRKITS